MGQIDQWHEKVWTVLFEVQLLSYFITTTIYYYNFFELFYFIFIIFSRLLFACKLWFDVYCKAEMKSTLHRFCKDNLNSWGCRLPVRAGDLPGEGWIAHKIIVHWLIIFSASCFELKLDGAASRAWREGCAPYHFSTPSAHLFIFLRAKAWFKRTSTLHSNQSVGEPTQELCLFEQIIHYWEKKFLLY